MHCPVKLWRWDSLCPLTFFSYFDIRGIPSPAELGQSSKAREVKGRAAQPWPRNSIDPRAFHRRHKNK